MENENLGTMKDKIAIITGGSRGLGRNTAVNLARRGVDIIFTYRANQVEAESLIREIEVLGRKAAAFRLDTGDVREFDGFVADVRKTLPSWGRGRFDYLVNNAGNSVHASFAETTEAQFDEIVNVHFKGVYFLTQKLLPLINDGGRIVNISSGWRDRAACKLLIFRRAGSCGKLSTALKIRRSSLLMWGSSPTSSTISLQ